MGGIAVSGRENGAGRTVFVSPAGSDDTGTGAFDVPFATIGRAARTSPGSLILVRGGTYGPVFLGPECAGCPDSPTVIRAAEGERPVIRPEKSGEGSAGIRLLNVGRIVLEGLEVIGGRHGIRYESTREAGDAPLSGIVFRGCTVHGIRGVHGICVYARNDRAPVTDLRVEGCEVYDCECGSSESLVLNGNIDGFRIAGNRIHDNNNIGIDMIGFEGTARSPEGSYRSDCARNGVCRDNVVWNICTEGNEAYRVGDHYDHCAGGIYVDGGQNIEITRNFVFCCDIGIEVATEHSPLADPLFRVTGVEVRDNVIAGCRGWTGLCFGGYARDLGFTEDCGFERNTLIGNAAGIAVQRSRNNRVRGNLLLGGDAGIIYNESCRPEDLVNRISDNAAGWTEGWEEGSWRGEYGEIVPTANGSLPDFGDVGSRFIPDREEIEAVPGIGAVLSVLEELRRQAEERKKDRGSE